MKRLTFVYLSMLALAGAAILGVLRMGASLPPPGGVAAPDWPVTVDVPTSSSALMGLLGTLRENLDGPLGHLFLQMLVVIGVSRAIGWLFSRVGQPTVVGEMAAGIVLGPSLFGLVAPGLFTFVFPASSLDTLRVLSQVGVCLFMFSVGMELNTAHIRGKAQSAVAVSHASIVVPYLLGVILAYSLFDTLAAPGTTFTAFALFMGISMSITAFPVLARILQERGLSRTSLGTTAIACAAVDDVTAWTILAFVVAVARSTSLGAFLLNLILIVLFVAVMLTVVRHSLPRWLDEGPNAGPEPSARTLAIVVSVVVASSLITEVIGIHALFGAFLAGAVMPDSRAFRARVSVRVESFSSVLLLPLFFAFTGLRTQIGLLDDLDGWLLCLFIVGIATVGKVGGSAIAARLTGMRWPESLQLGALMNTRGLMELVALNIGYDLGILSPRIFAMLVIMALVTTMMTGPLLTLFGARQLEQQPLQEPARA